MSIPVERRHMPGSEKVLEIHIGAVEDLFLDELSGVLYDTILLYDAVVLATGERYESYRFTQYFYRRNGRPLRPADRLRLDRIAFESPGVIEIASHAVLAIPALVYAYERVRDRPQRRRKLVAEADKAVAEATKTNEEARILAIDREERALDLEERRSGRPRPEGVLDALPEEASSEIERRGAEDIVRRQVERINETALPIESVSVRTRRSGGPRRA